MSIVDRFARVRLSHLPTPLEPMPRLSRHLGGPEIWVKRDDCTGLGLGGNKVRKLEFLIAEALSVGADTIITAGGPQSNHARQTAAAAARCGLRCILVLIDSVRGRDDAYYLSGNTMLDRLFGASVIVEPAGTDATGAMAAKAQECAAGGRRAYVIPIGGSNATGSLGYVQAAHELHAQSRSLGLDFTRLVVPSGSGGTHAGLAVGLAYLRAHTQVVGYCIGDEGPVQRAKITGLLQATCDRLEIESPQADASIVLQEGVLGTGYGQPTSAMKEAVELVATLEGLALDPVYTGKAMAGLIAAIRNGQVDRRERVLFLHTGGSPALFAYPDVFSSVALGPER